MDCKACGYEEYEGENPSEFIRINGYFTVDSRLHGGQIRTVRLYACPKCKTVVLDDECSRI